MKFLRFFSLACLWVFVIFCLVIAGANYVEVTNHVDRNNDSWYSATQAAKEAEKNAKASGLSDSDARTLARETFISTGPDK